jgi:hypothetical protein
VVIRLDGCDPLDPPAASADDYQREYEGFWLSMRQWLAREQIEPLLWPADGWWKVELAASFHPEDMPRVVAWLNEQGRAVE